MLHSTSRELYAYWDRVRNGRAAPCRFEIDPARIAPLLPETFIAERAGPASFRFRLAGTRICEQFGRELRGIDFLTLWEFHDRGAITSLIRGIFSDGAVGHGRFLGHTRTGKQAEFEFVLLPLIHSGTNLDRLLGAITVLGSQFWLGAEALERLELLDLDPHWPGEEPSPTATAETEAYGLVGGRFRVLDGGKSTLCSKSLKF